MKQLMYSALMSFLISFLVSAVVVKIYYDRNSPQYYSFDLNRVIEAEKHKLLADKNMTTDKLQKEVARYMTAVDNYVNSYAANGIVFVGGATVGNSPYVQDITGGFFKAWNSRSGANKATK